MEEPYLLTSSTLVPSQLSPPSQTRVEIALGGTGAGGKKNGQQGQNRIVTQVPGVGLTVYDANDQTPLSSLTLGPSFQPTTSPTSRSSKSIRRTWTGVRSQSSDEGGKEKYEVLVWEEEERKDGSSKDVAGAGSGREGGLRFPLQEKLTSILSPPTLPSHLLLLSSTGTLSLHSEASLSHLVSLPLPSSSSSSKLLSQKIEVFNISPLKEGLIPSEVRGFLENPSKAHFGIVVRTFGNENEGKGKSMVEITRSPSSSTLSKKKRPTASSVLDEISSGVDEEGERTEIELVLIDPEVMSEGITNAGIVSFGSVEVRGKEVGVSKEGFVSALGPNNTLDSYRLSIPSLPPSSLDTYASLYSLSSEDLPPLILTPINSLPLSSTLPINETKLLALHSSFVISATTIENKEAGGAGKVKVLVWDTRLKSLVHDTDISIPNAVFPPSTSTSTTSTKRAQLRLERLSPKLASLAICPSANEGGKGGRSVVFLLPLVLPSESVLVSVVGKFELTRKYLRDVNGDGGKDKGKKEKKEPFRHPKTSEKKAQLLRESEERREAFLETLEKSLAKKVGGVAEAEKAFDSFVEKESTALSAYNSEKLALALEKEKERRNSALVEQKNVKLHSQKYRLAKKKIEGAIAEGEKEGKDWKEVTQTRIKGVEDRYRWGYFDERKKFEGKLGKEVEVKEIWKGLEKGERMKIALPSSFVNSIIKLSFPKPNETSTDLATPSTKEKKDHPAKIVEYLLERNVVADSILEGGLTSYLARAGDWNNVQTALRTLPDIAESTSIELLRQVVQGTSGAPSLRTFLTSFVQSPATPTLLRQSIQSQLTADDVLPALVVLDSWLAWWAMRGGGGGEVKSVDGDGEKRTPKRLPSNPFVALTVELVEDEKTPPRVEDIVPLVQAILDAHFVNLLLQRRAHPLLRRLATHVATHVAIQNDLSTLLGALSVYARTKDEQRAAQAAQEALDEERILSGKKKGKKVVASGVKKLGAVERQKELGASMAARIAAQEKHNEVGAYEVDKFWL